MIGSTNNKKTKSISQLYVSSNGNIAGEIMKKKNFFQKVSRDFTLNKTFYLMSLPIIIYYIIFQYLPLGGLVIAFQKYNLFKGVKGSQWVGFANFTKFFSNPHAFRLIRNTFVLSLYSIIFSFPTPIVFALMVNEVSNERYKKISQTISYMPHFISLIVICGMIHNFSSADGLFNSLIILFGGKGRTNLLSNVNLFRAIYIGSGIWQGMGWSSIIYIATLSNVDPNLYDAAYIDGAGRFRRIIYVTFPAIVPIISIQLIMRMGRILSVGFEKIILLYNPLTYEKADVISTYVYRFGLQNANYSYGTAVGIFNSLINIMILVLVNKGFRKFTSNSLW